MKRTKEEAEQTKRKLIDIALSEFVKHGFENITLENIAEKANVTRGAIYWHFNNKEDLMDSLIKIKDAESLEHMAMIYKSDMPVMKKLFELINANFPVVPGQKAGVHYAKLKIDLYNYYLKNGDNRKIGKTFVKYTELLLKQAQKEGKIKKEINTGEAAYVIYTIIGGLMMRHPVNPGKYKSMQSLRNILKNYIKQLEN
ncbi:MAG: TetR family transcriptional regulator [Bacteroidetes bacterium]|nr:TetR family transcriptional regulator [Bacteroidota bacterium]